MKYFLILAILVTQSLNSLGQDSTSDDKHWNIGINLLSITKIQRNNNDIGFSNFSNIPAGIMAKKRLKKNTLRVAFDYYKTSFSYTSTSSFSTVDHEIIYYKEMGNDNFF
ncbi:MAG: hypothetical protein GC181_13395 [Bacteroidetes bacterium]|nr:hypothetical protein [Bacteroidota bacterium]